MSCMHNFWYSSFSLSHWLSSTSQRLEICINHRFYTTCIIMWNLVNRIERCIVIFCLLRINQTIELHEKCQSAECSPKRDLSQNESDNLCGPVYACLESRNSISRIGWRLSEAIEDIWNQRQPTTSVVNDMFYLSSNEQLQQCTTQSYATVEISLKINPCVVLHIKIQTKIRLWINWLCNMLLVSRNISGIPAFLIGFIHIQFH